MNAASLGVRAYTTELIEKSSWWGLSTSTSVKETYKNLPSELIQTFADTFRNGYEAIMTAGVTLGMNEADLNRALRAAKVDIGKVDFTGLSQQEIADRLSQVFSEAFSGVVNQIPRLFNLVNRYTKATESSLETLGRIAVEYDQASFQFGLIGKEFKNGTYSFVKTWTETTKYVTQEINNTGNNFSNAFSWMGRITTVSEDVVHTVTQTFHKLVQSTYTTQMQILDIVKSTGGIEKFNDAMNSFIKNFYTNTEQFQMMEKSMRQQFSALGLSMPKTKEQFRQLLETMDTSTEYGARLYGQVLSLAEGFAQMTNAAENLNNAIDKTANAINTASLTLQYISQYTGFKSAILNNVGSTEEQLKYAIEAANAMLISTIHNVKIYGVNSQNYLEKFLAAERAGELTEKGLAAWQELGDALIRSENAAKAYSDYQNETMVEILDFNKNILNSIKTAYEGTLSYFNSIEKASYLDKVAKQYLATGDTQSYFDTLYKQLEYEKKMSKTKEEYAMKFDSYVSELQNVDYIPKTTNDVVNKLEDLIDQNKRIEDAIAGAAYQAPLSTTYEGL